jgi:hypothetical protein
MQVKSEKLKVKNIVTTLIARNEAISTLILRLPRPAKAPELAVTKSIIYNS